MAPNTKQVTDDGKVYRYVDLKTVPSFTGLQNKVRAIVAQSSWWDLYGVDWVHIVAAVACVSLGLWILSYEGFVPQLFGVVLAGCYHGILSNKSGHLAVHDALGRSPTFNRVLVRIFVDFVGGFSSKLATDIHIKVHHPHTNIIGLGDSSTWRAPSLSRIPYMFLVPLLMPILTPLVALQQLLSTRDWLEVITWFTLATSGAAFHVFLLVYVSGFSVSGAVTCLLAYRALLSIPYIHVNIFQHIGLPMFSQGHRPVRIYQMSEGVINLDRHWFLDATFGHSLISCHVEHHLFPRLSDNMCLKVKPVVREYLLENKLQYKEDSYTSRLRMFFNNYDTLMVDAPPITHFVGLQ